MVLGVRGHNVAVREDAGAVLCSSRLVQNGGRVLRGNGSIGVPHNHRHVAHAPGLKRDRHLAHSMPRYFQEIIAQCEVFDGVSRDRQLSAEKHLCALIVSLLGELQKSLDVLRPVAHSGVSLGQGQAKTGHTK